MAKHGLERLAQRGATQELVEQWVKNGKALFQNGGSKFLFITPEGAAVVANDGTLVTVMPASFYDAKMLEVVERLFGK